MRRYERYARSLIADDTLPLRQRRAALLLRHAAPFSLFSPPLIFLRHCRHSYFLSLLRRFSIIFRFSHYFADAATRY